MKTPWLRLALFTGLLAQAPACATSNALFCEQDEDCQGGERCDEITQSCYPAGPDASFLTDPTGTTEEGAVASDESAHCPATSDCVGKAPEGWLGPVARAHTEVGEELAECGGDFASEVAVMQSDIELSGSCSCECDDVQGLQCGSAKLWEWTSTEPSCEIGTCTVFNGSCLENSQLLSPNACTPIVAAMKDEPFLQAQMGQVVGGSCGQASVGGQLDSQLATRHRLCAATESMPACAAGQVCAPTVPAGFDEELCIVQEGEHECPANSSFSERVVLFTGIEDTRSCGTGSCNCSVSAGACNGRVDLTMGDEFNCTTVLATLEKSKSLFGSDNICSAIPANAKNARYVVDLDNQACRRTGQAEVAGTVEGQSPTTVCCMPGS